MNVTITIFTISIQVEKPNVLFFPLSHYATGIIYKVQANVYPYGNRQISSNKPVSSLIPRISSPTLKKIGKKKKIAEGKEKCYLKSPSLSLRLWLN